MNSISLAFISCLVSLDLHTSRSSKKYIFEVYIWFAEFNKYYLFKVNNQVVEGKFLALNS